MQDSNWAAENLQVIRTLMERAALYRRALAPIMAMAGLTGIAAAIIACLLKIESAPGFIGYWIVVALLGLMGALLMVRRQALKSAEPFWSPPTRRVAQALSPCLTAGLSVGVLVLIASLGFSIAAPPSSMIDDAGDIIWLPAVWAVFYGCALHAAGFFTLRGLRLLGWLFVVAGIAVFWWLILVQQQGPTDVSWQASHWLMGGLFGLSQLAYGGYLFMTGEESNDL